MNNVWENGIFGVVVGDALGCPVQFESRAKVATHPVRSMRGYGTFNLPEGSWTDDSSLTLALLDSITINRDVNLRDIMDNFVKWYTHGEFTPYGYAYDIGGATANSIERYIHGKDVDNCGTRGEWENGNGSLMRILPVCIYLAKNCLWGINTCISIIHDVSALTHAHMRSKIACGLYYFMVNEIINGYGTIRERVQRGLNDGFMFYKDEHEISHYDRLRDLDSFVKLDNRYINSSGYVVDTLEACIWCLLTSLGYRETLLKAVNLGLDTDTVGAVTGGLAGLFYGYTDIPEEWINVIKKREMIHAMCEKAQKKLG